MNVTITIERLILDGIDVPHRLRPQVQAAMESELAHLIQMHGLANTLQTHGMHHKISAGAIELQRDEKPSVLGKKIAQAVYKGIGQ